MMIVVVNEAVETIATTGLAVACGGVGHGFGDCQGGQRGGYWWTKGWKSWP